MVSCLAASETMSVRFAPGAFMSNLSDAVDRLRAEYCEGCRQQYTREEILDGEQCEFCDHVEATGRMVASLQD